MGKRNKSKRFVQQGKDSVSQHDQRFPYHMTFAEAQSQKKNNEAGSNDPTLGGF